MQPQIYEITFLGQAGTTVRAEFEDGVLLVTVPRPPETKPRVKKIGLKGR